MKQRKLFAILLTPSLLSGVLVILLTMLVFMTTVWDSYKNLPIVKGYISNLQDVSVSIGSGHGAMDSIRTTVLSNTLLNQLLFIVFWALVGLIAYLVVSTLSFWVKDSATELKITSFARKRRERSERLKERTGRLILRLIIILVWFIYVVVFLRFLVPACILSFRVSTVLGWRENWQQVIGGIVVLLLSLHIHTVFMRLTFFRARVFGSDVDALASKQI